MRRIIAFVSVLTMTLSILPVSAAPDGGLVLHYDCDEGSGDVLRDRSGNGHDGKIVGAAFVAHGDGSALEFDGAGDFVDCGISAGAGLSGAASVVVWFRPLEMSASRYGASLVMREGAYDLMWYSYGNCWWQLSGTPRASVATSEVVGPSGRWHHVAATFDGQTVKVHVDGRAPATVGAAGTRTLAAGKIFWLGKQNAETAEARFLLDDVRVYDRALSADEIAALHRETNPARGIDVVPHVYYFAGQVVAQLDTRGPSPVPPNATVEVELLGADGAAVLDKQSTGPIDAERTPEVTFSTGRLKPGEYRLRAIPEIVHDRLPSQPHTTPFGLYDLRSLGKDVVPNVNVIVGGVGTDAERAAWKKQGKHCIHEIMAFGLGQWRNATAEQYADYLGKIPGLVDPLYDGAIIDEFSDPGDGRLAPGTTEALRRIWGPQFAGRRIDIFAGGGPGHYGKQEIVLEFRKAVLDAGGRFIHERYLPTQRTEAQARAFLDSKLTAMMRASRRALPGAEQSMGICFGYFSAPPESLALHANVDYKVYLDMQFHHIATQASFFGLAEVMTYLSDYADEEVVRWAGRLFRHYCIEGRTDRLTRDPYILPHVANPDFEEGLAGWTVSAGAREAVGTDSLPGLGVLRANWGGPGSDAFVSMKRCEAGPNSISQTVKGLEAGRLYSLRFYSADVRELLDKKSVKRKHAVRASLEDVDLVPEKCFQHVYAAIHGALGFDGGWHGKNRAWLNFHRQVFRAKRPEARLTISDWAGADDPGGPVGEQLLVSFVQVQPYLDD